MTSAPSRSQRVFTVLAFLAVAGLTAGAFVLSYEDLRLLALAGLKGDDAERFARYYPAVYDGLVAIALLAVFVARHSPWWVRWMRWLVLVALAGGAAAASVQNALKGFGPIEGTALDAGVASAPWVAALLAIWLWMSMFRQIRDGAQRRTRRSRKHTPAHARSADGVPEPVTTVAEERHELQTDPLPLPTAADFPNPYRDLVPAEPVDPVVEADPGENVWEPTAGTSSPWPYIDRDDEPREEPRDDEPGPPRPVLPEPVRPPVSLPTDVKLVGRTDGPARDEAPEDPEEAGSAEDPEDAEEKPVSTTRPDLPMQGSPGREQDEGAAEDWATYSPERHPPSGGFRSGPLPPKDA